MLFINKWLFPLMHSKIVQRKCIQRPHVIIPIYEGKDVLHTVLSVLFTLYMYVCSVHTCDYKTWTDKAPVCNYLPLMWAPSPSHRTNLYITTNPPTSRVNPPPGACQAPRLHIAMVCQSPAFGKVSRCFLPRRRAGGGGKLAANHLGGICHILTTDN